MDPSNSGLLSRSLGHLILESRLFSFLLNYPLVKRCKARWEYRPRRKFGNVGVWVNASGRLLCQIQGHKGAVKHIDLTPHGHGLVTSGEDGTIRVWDMEEILTRQYAPASPLT